MAKPNNLALSPPHDWTSFDQFSRMNAGRPPAPVVAPVPQVPQPDPLARTVRQAAPGIATGGAPMLAGIANVAAQRAVAPAPSAPMAVSAPVTQPDQFGRRRITPAGVEEYRDTASGPRWTTSTPTGMESAEMKVPGYTAMTPEQRAQALQPTHTDAQGNTIALTPTGLKPVGYDQTKNTDIHRETDPMARGSFRNTMAIDPKYGGGVAVGVEDGRVPNAANPVARSSTPVGPPAPDQFASRVAPPPPDPTSPENFKPYVPPPAPVPVDRRIGNAIRSVPQAAGAAMVDAMRWAQGKPAYVPPAPLPPVAPQFMEQANRFAEEAKRNPKPMQYVDPKTGVAHPIEHYLEPANKMAGDVADQFLRRKKPLVAGGY